MIRELAFLLMSFSYVTTCGQVKGEFTVMCYNVENLFDCKHDTLKDDYEFLPDSPRHWNYTRFKKKVANLSRVIVAVGEWSPPGIVGLCEVENDYCLKALTRFSPLSQCGYKYIVTHSDDVRGIDVALLYLPHCFHPDIVEEIQVPRPDPELRPTRDILYVCGRIPNGQALHVFVVHFPSRNGGVRATANYRQLAAISLRQKVDEVLTQDNKANIIIMGDFNDGFDSPIFGEDLKVTAIPNDSGNVNEDALYHLFDVDKTKYRGSYKYKGRWELIDHIIVSGSILKPSSLVCVEAETADVFTDDFLLDFDDNFGGKQPFRTYLGKRYNGGYSDHLPVYTKINYFFAP